MTFRIVSLGCVKNQVDAEIMDGVLRRLGWQAVQSGSDWVLVNTCGFIRSAQEESLAVTQALLDAGERVVLTGCLSQRWAHALLKAYPKLAGCFGNRRPELIGEFLLHRLSRGERVWLPEAEGADVDEAYRDRPLHGLPFVAFVKLSEGCDHRCAYCAIPLIRGPQRDRPQAAVLREVEALLARGVREINLVAHDLASWGGGLVELVKTLDRWPGRWWLRLLYLYPERFPLSLVDLLAEANHLVPYFDLPIQHGSPTVLKRMGRSPQGPSLLLDLAARLRQRRPEVALRTTFIAGYRGETEEEFQQLVDFQGQLEPDWAGIFPYSHEEGTPAFGAIDLGPLPPSGVVKKRVRRFERLQMAITRRRLEARLGTRVEVLVEERLEGTSTVLARAPFQAPEVDGLVVVTGTAAQPGDFLDVELQAVRGVDLLARPLNPL